MQITVRIFAVLAVVAACELAAAQQNQSTGLQIQVGQSIADVQAALMKRGITASEGLGDESLSTPDDSALNFHLDKNAASVIAYFSKSRKTVTHLSVVFFTPGNRSKTTDLRLSAQSITLNDDGSYVPHLLPMKTLQDVPNFLHRLPGRRPAPK